MRENMVNAGHLVVLVGWSVVAMLMTAAWVVTLAFDLWRIGGLLAATGCASSAAAATLHIRRYSVKVCRLVNATADMGASGGMPSAPFGHVTKMR